MVGYQRFGTINRTVLLRRPWWPVDWQSVPPYGWCVRCGSEVFAPGREQCDRCSRQKNAELTH